MIIIFCHATAGHQPPLSKPYLSLACSSPAQNAASRTCQLQLSEMTLIARLQLSRPKNTLCLCSFALNSRPCSLTRTLSMRPLEAAHIHLSPIPPFHKLFASAAGLWCFISTIKAVLSSYNTDNGAKWVSSFASALSRLTLYSSDTYNVHTTVPQESALRLP